MKGREDFGAAGGILIVIAGILLITMGPLYISVGAPEVEYVIIYGGGIILILAGIAAVMGAFS